MIEKKAMELLEIKDEKSILNSKVFEYLSTHPHSDERIKKFNGNNEEGMGCKNTPWKTVKVMAKEDPKEKEEEEKRRFLQLSDREKVTSSCYEVSNLM